MKQSLQLKIGQQLTMTPQLQQAIRLLQLSTLDLQQEIQEALETNPMLEVDETTPDTADNNPDTNTETPKKDEDLKTLQEKDDDWVGQLDSDIAVDTDWNDIFETGQTSSGTQSSENETALEARVGTQESLQDHLIWQLNLTPMSDRDRMIAETLIDAIAPTGWLDSDFDEIVSGFHPDWEIESDEVEAVLHLIQHFDPVGAGARTLQECLLVQLKMLSDDTPLKQEALLILQEHIESLGKREYALIQKKSGLKEEQLTDVLHLIQTLHPQPGEMIEEPESEYIVPDVFVSRKNNKWNIELNGDTAPKLKINPVYAALANRSDNSSDGTYLRNNLQEAKWFLKSLQSRNETLLKVTAAIVERQRMFLEYGEEAMKPMVLQDIAEAVEMHESTISRVTNRKYMHTPRGIFELKYFFSSHVSTSEGGECSSTAIRALIKKIVGSENPKKPLSDNKIAKLLEEQGIQVARRTIAKYRENLGIASSSERKRLV